MAFSLTDHSGGAWHYWAQQSPFSVALKTPSLTLNWQQLAACIDYYSAYLADQGVAAGDVVTLVGKNQPETVLFYLAAQQLGAIAAVTMPQPCEALQSKLQTLYQPVQQRFVWLAGECAKAYAANELASYNAHFLSVPQCPEWPSYPSCQPAIQYHHDALASIVFTSGSTGAPKAVAHTHRQHFASAEGLLTELSFTRHDTWLMSLPLYHVSGLAIVYRWLYAGATLKVGAGNLAADICGVSHASLVATQLKRLLDEAAPLSLTHVLLGGSHVAHSLAQRAKAQGIETWLGYGMTEAASTVTAKQVDQLSNAGHVLPNRRVRLAAGRIYIGGQTLAVGYYYQGRLTPLVDDDGWFDSKDLGQWQDNELKIIGRVDNQFISGGENIHCEEIEAALNQHPDVIQAIIVPVSDEEYGQRPVAVLQTKRLRTKADYECFLQDKLEKFKWPVAYHVLPESLSSAGIKVSRQAVKLWLQSRKD
ncbi:o-succinylbenzoate--CoA ligase [Vibrio sp. CAU 1672]|uniref:o-succinylbenzoate--CoA ligase n=1 Tax=Vibrio sp. CAU 1672 TaxID=3032594 RepID=UPI0023DCE0F5|nr:o-succinylbenzoate--CoA ligase [Vibrio sp. CAU 1672]MDF2153592.1 o-succinylbenzoate--CoA ligase [Vibrio sp. CAU 1672]